jgi:hypothetical protein
MKKDFEIGAVENVYFIAAKGLNFIVSFPYGEGLMRFETIKEAREYLPTAKKLYPEFTLIIIKRSLTWTLVK